MHNSFPFKLQPYQQALFNAAIKDGKLAPIALNPTRSILQHVQMFGRVLRPMPIDDPCDEIDHMRIRPSEPIGDKEVWYRGWGIAWSCASEYWCGQGWIAYKGGCDLDAPEIRTARFCQMLDEIDAAEDD